MIEQTVDQIHDPGLGGDVLCFWDCGYLVTWMGIVPIVLRVSPGDGSACARLGRRAVRGLGPATRDPPRLIAV